MGIFSGLCNSCMGQEPSVSVVTVARDCPLPASPSSAVDIECKSVSMNEENCVNSDGGESNPEPDIFCIMELPDLILTKIFSNLDSEQLKDCRLVCNQWEKFLRQTHFKQSKICCFYTCGGRLQPQTVRTSAIYLQIYKKLTRTAKKRKLRFDTLRVRNGRFLFFGDFYAWTWVNNLLSMGLKMKCVTRLEYDPSLLETITDERIYTFWENFLMILTSFPNLAELVILSQQAKVRGLLSDGGFTLGTDDLETRFLRLSRSYKKEIKTLRKLKLFVYKIECQKISEYLVFLKLIGNTSRQLVEFNIEVNYSLMWRFEFAQYQLFALIGEILKKNASTLTRVHIGTLNAYLGQHIRQRGLISRQDWLKYYSQFEANEIVEQFLTEMMINNWQDFGLNSLEDLTLHFPLPVFPSPALDAVLKPFLENLESLSTVKIQPIIARRMVGGKFEGRTVAQLNNIFKKKSFQLRKNGPPKIESDIVYLSEGFQVSWDDLKSKGHLSLVDMKYRTIQDQSRSIHWRNMSWENFSIPNSIISSQLRHLTQLVIYNRPLVTSEAVRFKITDQDMQLIVHEGKFLQEITLNCDLSELTHFGYSGVHLDFIKKWKARGIDAFKDSWRSELKGNHSILDLKDLRSVILIGLRGHVFPREFRRSRVDERAEFFFMIQFFTRLMNLDFLRMKYRLSGNSTGNPARLYCWEASTGVSATNVKVWD